MAVKLYVGNLPFSATEEELRELFSQAGGVLSLILPTDRLTGRPRGFAFIEMESTADAEKAVQQFNGYALDNRTIRVEMAKEREERGDEGRRKRGRAA